LGPPFIGGEPAFRPAYPPGRIPACRHFQVGWTR
jgi:hypothetical protein